MEGNNAFKWGRSKAEVVAGSRALSSEHSATKQFDIVFSLPPSNCTFFFAGNHLEILNFATRDKSRYQKLRIKVEND